MLLSEAIREGARLRPQTTEGDYFGRVDGVLCSCALGAAYEARDRRKEPIHRTPVEHLEGFAAGDIFDSVFPVVKVQIKCPVMPECGAIKWPADLGWIVAHLNDDHKWTREQIADFVATVEAQEVMA